MTPSTTMVKNIADPSTAIRCFLNLRQASCHWLSDSSWTS